MKRIFAYKYIAGSVVDSGTLFTGPCRLERFVINRLLANGDMTIYDSTNPARNIVAHITEAAGDKIGTLWYGCDLQTGLSYSIAASIEGTLVYSYEIATEE